MKGTILEKIIDSKRVRIEEAKRQVDLASVISGAERTRSTSKPHRLSTALSDLSRLNIIAEFKRASPSKGVISDTLDPVETARNYEKGGACAISVLTEEDHFKGSLNDLRAIRNSVDLPILRKDFIVDEYQIFEAAEAGADAVLLLVTVLPAETLKKFLRLAEHELSMDALVEVHTTEELAIAREVGATIIGVNNRNLKTFEVSLDVSRSLVNKKPSGSLMIAESGIVSRDEMIELRSLGFSGFLVGETLMRSGNAQNTLEAWT
jgi:indole-3-glycerol phosphate synthase